MLVILLPVIFQYCCLQQNAENERFGTWSTLFLNANRNRNIFISKALDSCKRGELVLCIRQFHIKYLNCVHIAIQYSHKRLLCHITACGFICCCFAPEKEESCDPVILHKVAKGAMIDRKFRAPLTQQLISLAQKPIFNSLCAYVLYSQLTFDIESHFQTSDDNDPQMAHDCCLTPSIIS